MVDYSKYPPFEWCLESPCTDKPQTPAVAITSAVMPQTFKDENLFDEIELFVIRYYLSCRDEGKDKEQCEVETYVAGVKEFATPPPEPECVEVGSTPTGCCVVCDHTEVEG